MTSALRKSQQHVSTIIESIKQSLNGRNGRWLTVFHIIENQNTVKIMLTASDNQTNEDLMNQFAQNIQQKKEEVNIDLSERTTEPVSINTLQALDITRDEAIVMSQDPNVVPIYTGAIEEEIDDWVSGIHKLIVFSI